MGTSPHSPKCPHTKQSITCVLFHWPITAQWNLSFTTLPFKRLTLVTTLKNATFVSTQIHLRGENLSYSRLFSMNYHNLKELQGLYEQGNVIVHHGKKWCTYPSFFNLFQDTHILWLHQWSKETETWKKNNVIPDHFMSKTRTRQPTFKKMGIYNDTIYTYRTSRD